MSYEIDNDTLVVTGELTSFMDMTFEVELSKLLDVESDVLIVDLMMVEAMTSQYIGQIAAFAQEAERKGRKVRVIASGKVANVLKVAGLEQFLELVLH